MGVVAVTVMSGCPPKGPDLSSLPVIFDANFEKSEDLTKWQATDAKAWKLVKSDGGQYLSLHKQCDYRPRVWSPRNFILLPKVKATTFVMDLKVKSTSPESPSPDVCLIFGYQSPAQFYYAHICDRAAEDPDRGGPSSHAIHVVDGRPRMSITHYRSQGVVWGKKWHHVRLVRVWLTGSIQVYFDDMKQPILTATDEQRFDLGRIGVGSFDDLACFDDIVVRGKVREKLKPVGPGDVPSPPPRRWVSPGQPVQPRRLPPTSRPAKGAPARKGAGTED